MNFKIIVPVLIIGLIFVSGCTGNSAGGAIIKDCPEYTKVLENSGQYRYETTDPMDCTDDCYDHCKEVDMSYYYSDVPANGNCVCECC